MRKFADEIIQDANQAMKNVYGDKNYELSDEDIEMMVEFAAIRQQSEMQKRKEFMQAATEQNGTEW